MSDSRKTKPSNSEDTDLQQRRKTLKRAAASGAAVVLTATSGKWQKPVVDSVLLPAHAATSSAVLNMRLTVRLSSDNEDLTPVSPSATAGNSADYINGDADDTMYFRARIHVDPPQATPVTLSYDNTDGVDSGPSSGTSKMTNSAGDATFNFSSDSIADDPVDSAVQNFRATVAGLSPAVVHLDFT